MTYYLNAYIVACILSLLSGCSPTVNSSPEAIREINLSTIKPTAIAEFSSRIVPLELPAKAVEIIHSDTNSSGGFSALWVSPHCERMITISDYSQSSSDDRLARSKWFEASIQFDDQDNLAGVTFIRSGQLRDMDGRIIPGAIEAMDWDGKGFLISFDDHGLIYRYPGQKPDAGILSGKPVVAYAGKNLSRGNAGLESLAALPDGRIFALWEKRAYAGSSVAWLISAHQTRIFSYQAIANPGGATTLPDGGVLVVEREFLNIVSGVRVRLVRLSPADLNGSNRNLKGQVIFDATSRSLDNFEGVSVCRRHGKELAFAISDNNGDWQQAFNIQSTLLMMIRLDNYDE